MIQLPSKGNKLSRRARLAPLPETTKNGPLDVDQREPSSSWFRKISCCFRDLTSRLLLQLILLVQLSLLAEVALLLESTFTKQMTPSQMIRIWSPPSFPALILQTILNLPQDRSIDAFPLLTFEILDFLPLHDITRLTLSLDLVSLLSILKSLSFDRPSLILIPTSILHDVLQLT